MTANQNRPPARESEERYRLLVEGARGFAIMMLDPAGSVAIWNAGAEGLFGYRSAEILGTHFSCFFSPEDNAAHGPERVLERARSADTSSNEHWMLRKDGTRFWGSGTTTVLRDETGAVIGFAKIVRDITDRRALEEDLRRRVDELKLADRSKNEFLAVLSHELRNPLALLNNVVRLLRDPRIDEAARIEAQGMMGRQVSRIVRLVDDLLDVARITQGKIHLRKAEMELSSSILQAVENVRPILESRRQEIGIELPGKEVWLDADAVRMQQVFGNLLDNASKFSPVGGRIRIAAQLSETSRGSEVVVRVVDEGVGLDSDTLGRIFDLFMQADNSASRSQTGLGIGLTLTRSLVELHGGTIEAKSEGKGKGSQFIVRLPVVARRGTPVPSSESLQGNGVPSARRILVVDDNSDGAKALAMLLQAYGHEVRVVFTGQDCLELVEDFRPQVVLLDLGLPGMDGYEVAQHLRRQAGMEDLLLIAVSGYGRDEDRRKTREAGFDHHLVKPADLDALHRILDSLARQE